MAARRVVVDTNTLLDFALFPESFGFRAVKRLLEEGWEICFSPETFAELAEVLMRTGFDRYLSVEDRQAVLVDIRDLGHFHEVTGTVRKSRDAKDDKFLELALASGADLIVSRDGDLLVLDPFEGIPVVSPQSFLAPGK